MTTIYTAILIGLSLTVLLLFVRLCRLRRRIEDLEDALMYDAKDRRRPVRIRLIDVAGVKKDASEARFAWTYYPRKQPFYGSLADWPKLSADKIISRFEELYRQLGLERHTEERKTVLRKAK